MLADKKRLLRNYSQNIDGLEFLADVPAERLVECHGHFRTTSCITCGKQAADLDAVKKQICDTATPPYCVYCEETKKKKELVKPDIVFFGEDLPPRFHKLLPYDVASADLCLVLGTSLQVAPVSQIPQWVKSKRILLNREQVGGIGRHTKRDLFHGGDCDESIVMISHALGWHDELQERYRRAQNGTTETETADE